MKTWDCFPILGGVSITTFFVTTQFVVNTQLMAAYSLYYIIVAMYSVVIYEHHAPWNDCGHVWNSPDCITRGTLLDRIRNNTQEHIFKVMSRMSEVKDKFSFESMGNCTAPFHLNSYLYSISSLKYKCSHCWSVDRSVPLFLSF